MILITGANGFIGSNLAHFLTTKHKLVLVDIVSPVDRPKPLQNLPNYQYLDRSKIKTFLNQPEARQIKAILHMGANSSTTETNWQNLVELNIQDSQMYANWCTENSVPFIYASSAATYGAGEAGFDDSTSPENLNPLNLYGKSKLEFDSWMLKQKSTPAFWYGLKFFNVFGPGENHKGQQASVFFHAFNQIKETGRLKLFKSHRSDFNDGEQKRDFIYVKDLCKWIEILLVEKPQSGIYNMGSGSSRTWLDLGRSVFSAMGLEPKIDFIDIPANIRDQYQYFTEAKMNKLFFAGLPKASYSLEEGAKDYVQKYLMVNK